MSNDTSSGIIDTRPEAEKIFKTVLIACIVLAIALSNMINLIVLRKTKQIPSNARICLVNLSIADICVGLISCAPCVYPAYTGEWPYGLVFCQITGIFHGCSVTISIWSLSLVSVDRYFAILHPLRYHAIMTPTRIYITLATFWAVASTTFFVPILLKAPTFIYYRFTIADNICGLYWEFPLFCVVTAVYIPVASGSVLLFTNYRIMKTIYQLNKVSPAETAMSSRNPEQATKKDFKAVKVLIITSAVYFTAWGPYVLYVLVTSAFPDLFVPDGFRFFFMWLANSNSLMNVIIYSLMYKSFRKQALVVIKGILTCNFDFSNINETRVNTFS